MGYRHYMYTIDRELATALKEMSYEELANKYKDPHDYDDDLYFSPYNLPSKQIYCFGKLYDDDTAERIYRKGKPLFNEETMDELSDYEVFEVDKEGLIEAILIYEEKIIQFYQSLLQDDQPEEVWYEPKTAAEKQTKFIKSRAYLWEKASLVNTNIDQPTITGSWEYEHSIFELIHLLKTIDFDKNTIIFYGW